MNTTYPAGNPGDERPHRRTLQLRARLLQNVILADGSLLPAGAVVRATRLAHDRYQVTAGELVAVVLKSNLNLISR